jgi:phospholipid/cholesterol/gamma-HCH transport system substrate-binding protein
MQDDRSRGNAPRKPLDDAEIQAAMPREVGGREVRVGIFVLLGILAAVAVLFVLTDPATLRGRYMVVTPLENAGGIRRGDPVQMRGVNVGRIHSFDMVGSSVNITLEIEGAWAIPADSYTRLAGTGLFGGRTMEIVPGVRTDNVPEGDTLLSVGEEAGIFGTAEVVGAQASTVLEQLNLLLAEPTITAVQGTAAELHALSAELRGALTVQQQQLNELTASLRRSALEVERAAGAAPDVASVAARADTAMVQIALTARTLEHTTSVLDSILSRFEAGEGTLGRLARDESLYLSLNQAAESIALLATDIRENPRRYFRIGLFGF